MLLNLIKERLSNSVGEAKLAMDAAQEAANSEGKSSMGDKYETGRAMAQLDRNMYARQYEQQMQELQVLERIGASPEPSPLVKAGSLVRTSIGWVLLAVSLGVLETDGYKILVVSGQSPLGKAVLGKGPGERFLFQGKAAVVEQIL